MNDDAKVLEAAYNELIKNAGIIINENHSLKELLKLRNAEIKALREALGDAAKSLETVANSGGPNGDPLLQHPSQIRGYANSRAISARAALGKKP
jgi:hypothetical protein